ncbi:hypothetical protein [Amycolatopsis sp. FDAARGOS 1241]|uniref:hypothetical protein n=1 Tax=Amycolatopsis sp. FDAARGOS 1241 TaxID=2778070 RepID=UPI00194DB9BC|nr:hypothetical protein [Amycolatopsis sp. FDAARGOS 1241]QRP42784.1 hypothetical protein I6J71_25255 [Amycolatopsis sp. FDAARGOS 1241]
MQRAALLGVEVVFDLALVAARADLSPLIFAAWGEVEWPEALQQSGGVAVLGLG